LNSIAAKTAATVVAEGAGFATEHWVSTNILRISWGLVLGLDQVGPLVPGTYCCLEGIFIVLGYRYSYCWAIDVVHLGVGNSS